MAAVADYTLLKVCLVQCTLVSLMSLLMSLLQPSWDADSPCLDDMDVSSPSA